MTWPRPIPLIGDQSTAAQRGAQPDGWRFPEEAVSVLYDVVRARRDVRRFRPDAVPDEVLERVLGAAHAAPSVGHSQPWRFVVVDDPSVRERAAVMADVERLAQAAQLDPESSRHLLDLQLEGIREAPLGVVVCCDRRTPAAGVLGRATYPDADLWSCACAIENLWLAARAEGLGLGWVTLFQPDQLAALLNVPPGVVTLGWLCLGWPDERAPAPGLERFGWSRRAPLRSVVLRNGWPDVDRQPPAPPSRLRAPDQVAVVGTRDDADTLLTPLGSLGVLDRALDRATALGLAGLTTGTLVLAAGRHRVTDFGVSAFAAGVTDEVLEAARAGQALGVVAARAAGLDVQVVDAGSSTGNLRDEDALAAHAVEALLDRGQEIGAQSAHRGLVALGEVGVGNTTVAAALAASLLGCAPDEVVGLGSGADSDMVGRKAAVVEAALSRCGCLPPGPVARLAALGGPEFAFLTGVVLGAARSGGLVVLDGLATSVCALIAMEAEPAVAAHLVAGQRSRERAHPPVLRRLGLEPLLDLRLRSGEGVGAVLASELVLMGLRIRMGAARTATPATER